MANINGKNVAVVVMDGFEETELTEPVKALREQGANVRIFSDKRGKVQAFRHHDKSITIDADATFDELDPARCDAVLVPGGALNADTLRMQQPVREFVKKMAEAHKPMAVICHGPWLLASTGVARGHKITSFPTIQDDLRNAGANWVDQEVVVDDNIVTSRKPDDIPAFNREFIRLLESEAPIAAR